MDETVALAAVTIARPRLAPDVEVVVAEPGRRQFPPRLSTALGICLKSGPAHRVTADGREQTFPADGVCVRAPGCVWETSTGLNGFVSIDVPSTLLTGAWLGSGMRFAPRCAFPDVAQRAQALLSADSALHAEELIADLVGRAERLGFPERASRERRPRAVERARDYIHESFAARLTLEQIAAAAGLNKFSLVRRFRRTLGTTPHSYVVMLRIDRARELLAQGAAAADAALEVGFSDQAHLNRWFLRACGITPAAYARQTHAGQFRSRQQALQLAV
jgi:AraC-like DNA-binding protein